MRFIRFMFSGVAVICAICLFTLGAYGQGTSTGSGAFDVSINGGTPIVTDFFISCTYGVLELTPDPQVRVAAIEDVSVYNAFAESETHHTASRIELHSQNPNPNIFFPAKIIIYHRITFCCRIGNLVCCFTNFQIKIFESRDNVNSFPTTETIVMDSQNDVTYLDDTGNEWTIGAGSFTLDMN